MSSKNKYNPQPESSKSTYILGGLAIVVIAVLVIGGVIWQNQRSKPLNDGYGGVQNSEVQVQTQEDGIVLLGLPDAATTIDLFEDPMCPACRLFEERYGQQVAQAVDDGQIAVRFHMMNFLNEASPSKDYSTRAIAATQCVADSGDAIAYSAFHTALFDESNQPGEGGSSDLSNDDLAQLARDAGASDEAADCITSGSGVEQAGAHAAASSQALSAAGGNSTPSVVHNGTVIDPFGDTDWIANLQP
ncbi:DsbA family protein [Rhodococcus sp. NPDC058521]|uniref:DsbA family protein n=1 Tax=Rhodococcus sp. NPDC058521 TaxID=3346536 RepID=UPI0036575498